MRKRPSKRRIKARFRLGKWVGVMWLIEHGISTNMLLEHCPLRQAYRLAPPRGYDR